MKMKWIVVLSLILFAFNTGFSQNAYKAGKKDGEWTYYGSNKALLARHFYREGVKVGLWEFYDIRGVMIWTYNFNTASATYLAENTADGFYAYKGSDGSYIKKQPDVKTIWLSSQPQWNNFLVNNLKFHEESVPARVPGKVEIRIYVDENGYPTDYKLANDVEADMDKEALRVTKLYSPEFVPAKMNGKNVKSIYTVKISYKLADYR